MDSCKGLSIAGAIAFASIWWHALWQTLHGMSWGIQLFSRSAGEDACVSSIPKLGCAEAQKHRSTEVSYSLHYLYRWLRVHMVLIHALIFKSFKGGARLSHRAIGSSWSLGRCSCKNTLYMCSSCTYNILAPHHHSHLDNTLWIPQSIYPGECSQSKADQATSIQRMIPFHEYPLLKDAHDLVLHFSLRCLLTHASMDFRIISLGCTNPTIYLWNGIEILNYIQRNSGSRIAMDMHAHVYRSPTQWHYSV